MASWNIDTAHSSITFAVRHMVFAKVNGRFGKWQGNVDIADDVTKSKVEITIDASSIDTGVDQRDGHLKSPDFLDVAKFPALTFKSTRVESTGKESFNLHGELTIRGVTKPVTLVAEFLGRGRDPFGNDRAAYVGKVVIDRREFGLTWNQAIEAGGILVGDKVEIEANLQAIAAK